MAQGAAGRSGWNAAGLPCATCGYDLYSVPDYGRVIVCPECATVNSTDPELHVQLVGRPRLSETARRQNRALWLLATATGAFLMLAGLIGAAWPMVGVGGVLTVGPWIVSQKRPWWFARG